MKRSTRTFAACAALTAAAAIVPSAALATSAPPRPRIITSDLLTPLSLDASQNGTAYLSQNFAGLLTKVTPDGKQKVIASTTGDELGAVGVRGGTVYYATTGQDPTHPSAKLYRVDAGKKPRQIADLYRYEKTKNPDAKTSYGFVGLPADCAAQFDPAGPAGPASYTGIVDSHPYATLPTSKGVYVADAAANAILKVDKKGKVTTVAVLPPAAPVTITAEIAAAQGLPACVAGHAYRFEFVPTDVEQGHDGFLYVSSLPGGPEDPSLGARGAVYKVNPRTGKATKVSDGFVGAVNLAVGPDGKIAVAELFGGPTGEGQVTIVKPGTSYRTILPLTSPGAVEWEIGKKHSYLYTTTGAFVLGEQGPQPVGKLVVTAFRR